MRIKKRKSKFKDGEYLIQSQMSGRVDYRSNMVKLWNGLWAHKDEFERQNPQDFINIQPERQEVMDTNQRQTATYTTVTADDL